MVESLIQFIYLFFLFYFFYFLFLVLQGDVLLLAAIHLTPAIILSLKPHSFRNKQVHLFFLIVRYFIWLSKMQDKDSDVQNVLTFLTSSSFLQIVSCALPLTKLKLILSAMTP